MLCPSCNTPNRDDAKFCKKCGHPFPAEADEATEATEGTEVDQTAPPAQTSPGEASVAEDPSLAPTLILTPEQMAAYHQRRLQREERQGLESHAANGEMKVPQPVSSFASIQNAAGPQNAGNRGNAGDVDIAELPTVLINPAQNEGSVPIAPPAADEPAPIPPPPPHVAEQTAVTTTADAENTGSEGENMSETAPGQSEQLEQSEQPEQLEQPEEDKGVASEQSVPANDFAVLAVGTMVGERYEVTEVVSDDAQGHVYSVIDHQGYQHCWNCGTEENGEGDEFCNDCGAELLNMLYVMHEYPAGDSHAAEASVLQGDIVNTFVDQGKTYAIEQVHTEQNAFPNGIHLTAASDSDAGDVRRADPNEDSTLVLQLQRIHESIATPVGVFIVADGMGGHDNGQLASRVAINVIAERMVRELLNAPLALEKAGKTVQPADEETLVSLLQGAIEDANAAICEVNQREKTDMGSTITGFMIVGEHAYILNVGDSRTYMVRGGQIYQLTNDHSLVGQLVAGGLIAPDDVYTHPQRNQIFRSLGDKPNVQVDIFKQQLHPGDILLGCCDGLWEMIRNPQIESILNTASGPQAACTQLVETANANGGEDNISVVVVYVS